jgi:hypothetical protein
MNLPRRFKRHYTLAEASELLPNLRRWLGEIRQLQQVVERGSGRNSELFAEGRDLGGERINDQLRNLARMRDLLGQFQALEIQIKDLSRGLIDIPALRGEREIFLCWQEGETELSYWHELESGFAGRQRV